MLPAVASVKVAVVSAAGSLSVEDQEERTEDVAQQELTAHPSAGLRLAAGDMRRQEYKKAT
jgi:hypothetical protein